MSRFPLALLALAATISVSHAQTYGYQTPAQLLQSGPMVGACAGREAKLWVQTTDAARVQILYWDASVPYPKLESSVVQTSAADAFTAHFSLPTEPGRRYNYQVEVNGEIVERPYPTQFVTPSLWQYRGDPPNFSIAAGSCAYVNQTQYDRPGTPYGSDYRIFTSLAAKAPQAMIWMGDNCYLREGDFDSLLGVQARYTHTRSLPEMQPMLGAMANYAIWDDHDYGTNDSDRSYAFKDLSRQTFEQFWANPTFGVPGAGLNGITTQFSWGDATFFLLDDRWDRAPDTRTTGERTMLGAAQIQWLIDSLKTSDARWKIIVLGGPFLNTAKAAENYIRNFPAERAALLEALSAEKIGGVIFLSGDRHFSEVSKLERPGSYPLYDFTISSLTAGVGHGAGEANTLRVPGTHVETHNFGILNFSGPEKARVLSVETFDADGKALWKQSVRAAEVGAGK